MNAATREKLEIAMTYDPNSVPRSVQSFFTACADFIRVQTVKETHALRGRGIRAISSNTGTVRANFRPDEPAHVRARVLRHGNDVMCIARDLHALIEDHGKWWSDNKEAIVSGQMACDCSDVTDSRRAMNKLLQRASRTLAHMYADADHYYGSFA